MDMENINVPKSVLKKIKDTLRICSNIHHSSTLNTCLDRDITTNLVILDKLLNGVELTGLERLERTSKDVEYILCAAIHYDNGLHYVHQDCYGIQTGFVLSGWRHPNIIGVLPTNPHWLKDKFNNGDKEVIQKYEELNIKYGWQEDSLTRCNTIQGFLTSTGRFVDRKEAFKIALDVGQIDESCGLDRELFSEDLY